jgi:hypothetical protein
VDSPEPITPADTTADPLAVPPADPEAQPDGVTALVADIRQLASDAKTLAEAELAYQTSRAKVAGEAARNVAIYGVVAFVLAFFALGALTVGLLLALTPLVTAWGATAIVVGVLLIGAVACVMAALGRIKRLRGVLAGTAEKRA